jgi:hypothetical protein
VESWETRVSLLHATIGKLHCIQPRRPSLDGHRFLETKLPDRRLCERDPVVDKDFLVEEVPAESTDWTSSGVDKCLPNRMSFVMIWLLLISWLEILL